LDFIAPGIIAMGILFTSIFNGFELIWDKQFGFMKETFVAPVPRYQILLGKAIGGATVATLQGIAVLILTLLVGFTIPNLWSIPLAIGVMFLIALFFTLVGITIASFLEDMHGFQLIMNFLVMPIFFLSGALFPLNNLSGPLLYLVRLNPLSYGIDALRNVLLGTSFQFGLNLDLSILIGLSAIVLIIGTYFFNKIQIN
ncbi:MAG: ABC transporter permease, partial [Candidatus Nanoarchaeia archaeon]|nr:ABC transporter permease [Candidatus Nanoarchaeia archaeon]